MTDTIIAQTNATHDRFKVHTFAECFVDDDPEIEVIKGLLMQNSVTLWFGPGGVKKTYCLLDMAICIAHGMRFLDFETVQSPVFIVDEESGRKRMKKRLKRLALAHSITTEDNTPLFFWTLANFNVSRKTDLKKLQDDILDCGAKFCVIDAMIDIMSDAKDTDNSANQIQHIFHSLRTIAEVTGCHIALIDHSNRAGQFRGSGAKPAGVDLMFAVSSEQGSEVVRFTCEKTRDEKALNFAARINFDNGMTCVTATDVLPEEQKDKPFSDAQSYVLRFLCNGEKWIKEIEDNADVCNGAAARRATYKLAKLGFVERTNSGAKGADARYGLTAKGKLAVP